MLGSNSVIVAAASAAGQCGPAAAMLCDVLVKDAADPRDAAMSEREMFLARSEAALRARRAESRRKGTKMSLPRVNWRGVAGAVRAWRPRLAA